MAIDVADFEEQNVTEDPFLEQMRKNLKKLDATTEVPAAGLPATPQPPPPELTTSEALGSLRERREPDTLPPTTPPNIWAVTSAPQQDTGALPKGFAPADKKELQNKVEQTLRDETPTDRRAALEYLDVAGKLRDLSELEMYGAPGKKSFIDEMREKIAEAGKAQQAGYKTAADQYRTEVDAARKQEIWDKAIGAVGKVAAGVVGSHPSWVGAPESVLPVSEHYKYEPFGDKKADMDAAGAQYKAELGRLGAVPKIAEQQYKATSAQIEEMRKTLSAREKELLAYLKDRPGLLTKIDQMSKATREEVPNPLLLELLKQKEGEPSQYEGDQPSMTRAADVVGKKKAGLLTTTHLWQPLLAKDSLKSRSFEDAMVQIKNAASILSNPAETGGVAVVDDPYAFITQVENAAKLRAKKYNKAPTGEDVGEISQLLQSQVLGTAMVDPTLENYDKYKKWQELSTLFGIRSLDYSRGKVIPRPRSMPGEPVPPAPTKK
jgi:hypothetical protein